MTELATDTIAQQRAKLEESDRIKAQQRYEADFKSMATKYKIWIDWFHADLASTRDSLLRASKTNEQASFAFHLRKEIDTLVDGSKYDHGYTCMRYLNGNEVQWYVEQLAQQSDKDRQIPPRLATAFLVDYETVAKKYKAQGFALWYAGSKFVLTLWPKLPPLGDFDYNEDAFAHSLQVLEFGNQEKQQLLLQQHAADLKQRKKQRREYEEQERRRMRDPCVIM